MNNVKYLILGALALALAACEANFFETESPSAMDEAVFKSADLTEQAIGAIYNTFGEDKSFRNRLCGNSRVRSYRHLYTGQRSQKCRALADSLLVGNDLFDVFYFNAALCQQIVVYFKPDRLNNVKLVI